MKAIDTNIEQLYSGEYGDKFYIIDKNNNYIFPKYNTYNLPTIKDSSYYKEYKKYLNKQKDYNIKLKYEPKEHQLEAIKFIDNSKDNDILISASTGFGKTYCAINHISKSKNRYMIVCDRTVLIEQWIKSITEFTDIKEDEIGIIQQKYLTKTNIERYKTKCKIFIASIKTLSSRLLNEPKRSQLLDLLIKDFNITGIIIDEAHLKLHSLFLLTTIIPTNKIIFLTATPRRTFSNENRILNEIIPINDTDKCYEYKESDINVKHIIFTINSKLTNNQIRYINKIPPNLNFMPYNKHAYFRVIYSKDKFPFIYDTYIRKVLDLAEEAIGRNNLNIMITNENIAPLEKIKEKIIERYSDKKIILYYGDFKDKISINKEEDNFIILATNKNITAGFDMINLNLLINLDVSSNRTNLEQLIGRLRRKSNFKKDGIIQKYYVAFKDISHNKVTRTIDKQIENINNYLLKDGDTIEEVSLF